MPKFIGYLAFAVLAFSGLFVPADAAPRAVFMSPAGGRQTKVDRYVANPSAPLGSVANPIPRNSPTPAALAYKIVPSDPNVVTNGPVPDTAANRAKYGQPMSLTGKRSDPAGN